MAESRSGAGIWRTAGAKLIAALGFIYDYCYCCFFFWGGGGASKLVCIISQTTDGLSSCCTRLWVMQGLCHQP